jgi:5-methyltetrahydrofolate--homocysteine methyltransferase
MERFERLKNLFAEINEPETLALIRELVKDKADYHTIIQCLRQGMGIIEGRFTQGEYFLSELIMSGEIFRESMEIIKPIITSQHKGEELGRVVIGTIKGDIHDIGKNIVATMLTVSGFSVTDLGVDAAGELFIEKIKETRANIVGMSALLTTSYEPMKESISDIRKDLPLHEVKVIIGGGPIDQWVLNYVGADAMGKDASEAVKICKEIMGVS